MRKTLGVKYKNRFQNAACTQTLIIAPNLHRSHALKLLLALISLTDPALKHSFAVTAPLRSLVYFLFLLCLALASSLCLILPRRHTPSPPCLSLLHQKPAPGFRNEEWEVTGRSSMPPRTRTPKQWLDVFLPKPSPTTCFGLLWTCNGQATMMSTYRQQRS